MNYWIERTINNTSWLRFIIWVTLYISASIWAFALPGPWQTIFELTGSKEGAPQLPSTLIGFHPDQPTLAFSKIGSAMDQYLLFQLIDIPLAIIATFLTITVIAAGLKRFNLGATAFRFLLLLPLIYLFAEIVENAFLISMATSTIAAQGLVVIAQQSVTTAKIIINLANDVNMLVAVCALAIGIFFRKRNHKQ